MMKMTPLHSLGRAIAARFPELNPVRVAAMSTLLSFVACGGDHVGNLTQPAPVAVAATVAQPFTTDSSGSLQTHVRAGAEVVLTGVDSHKGPDNNGVPIISYSWSQLNAGNNPVDLIQRTGDTVSFIAPLVTSETTLNFKLTVTDSEGASASTQANVTVEPVRDRDHFLEYVSVNTNFKVAAATTAAVAPVVGVAADAMLPFTITVTKLVSFTDINGVRRDNVAVGQPVTYSGGWSTALGTGGSNCADARNPQLQIPIPRLNLDDSLADGSGPLSNVLETSDVNIDPPNPAIPPAIVSAQVQIQSTALPAGVSPQVCVSDAGKLSAPAASVTLSSDLLKQPGSDAAPYDSNAASHAYYATIDPSGSKATLATWLAANGFDPNAATWAADAHAVYTNNYDLGFGRDMYMKFGACDAGAASMPLQSRIGQCDVAAVVVNYASVQAAANKINPIVAVAMEYSAAPRTSPADKRFVKFYVFGPDTRTGQFQRVTSVDLDRRGQKSVPQSCVVCHGGTPATISAGATSYPNRSDVAAGFLTWDLDSFFFTDTDPGFSTKVQDAALRAQYTRANQEAQFKMLNTGAYLTLDDPNRFALVRELLEGWYGGVGLPNATFDGSFVPDGWKPGGPNDNPANSDTIYSNVFARHCRACHVLQAPAQDKVSKQYIDPRTATETVGTATVPACSAQSVIPFSPTPVAANQAHQIPMGCFWEFAHSPFFASPVQGQEVSVTLAALMPFARRTTDRLWVAPDGSPSPGAQLQSFFSGLTPPITVPTPGTSVAVITTPPPNAPESQITVAVDNDLVSGATPDVGNAVSLDSSRSAFADTILWSASACTGTPASPGDCSRSVPVVGSDTPVGFLILDDAVTYRITLKLDDGQGLATSRPYYYQVLEVDPAFLSPLPTIDVAVAGQTTVMPASVFTYGNGGPALNRVLILAGSGLAVTPASCTVAPGCTGADIAAGFLVQSTGHAASNSSLAITVTGAGSSPKEVVNATVPVHIM